MDTKKEELFAWLEKVVKKSDDLNLWKTSVDCCIAEDSWLWKNIEESQLSSFENCHEINLKIQGLIELLKPKTNTEKKDRLLKWAAGTLSGSHSDVKKGLVKFIEQKTWLELTLITESQCWPRHLGDHAKIGDLEQKIRNLNGNKCIHQLGEFIDEYHFCQKEFCTDQSSVCPVQEALLRLVPDSVEEWTELYQQQNITLHDYLDCFYRSPTGRERLERPVKTSFLANLDWDEKPGRIMSQVYRSNFKVVALACTLDPEVEAGKIDEEGPEEESGNDSEKEETNKEQGIKRDFEGNEIKKDSATTKGTNVHTQELEEEEAENDDEPEDEPETEEVNTSMPFFSLVLRPDQKRSWVDDEEFEYFPTGCIHDHHVDQLVNVYNNQVNDQTTEEDRSQMRLLLQKFYTHLTLNEDRYGVLSNYKYTWLCRRVQDGDREVFQISRAFPSYHVPPSDGQQPLTIRLLHGLDYLSYLIDIQTPQLDMLDRIKSIFPQTKDQAHVPCLGDSLVLQGKAAQRRDLSSSQMTLFRQIDKLPDTYLAKAQPDDKFYVLKIAKQSSPQWKELHKEREIYQRAADLQGTYIPTMAFYGSFLEQRHYCFLAFEWTGGVAALDTEHLLTAAEKDHLLRGLDLMLERGLRHGATSHDFLLHSDHRVPFFQDFFHSIVSSSKTVELGQAQKERTDFLWLLSLRESQQPM